MKGYAFTYGVDGFGNDIIPMFKEGIFLNYDEAYNRFKDLTQSALDSNTYKHIFYEVGYGECIYPDDNIIMKNAEENEDWDTYEEELSKHIISNIDDICKMIIEDGVPPLGLYCMVEVDIH